MKRGKNKYEDLSLEDKKKELVLQAHVNIMTCPKKCDEGYIITSDTAFVCDCCKEIFEKLKPLAHIKVYVSDKTYDQFIERRNDIYFRDMNGNIKAEPTLCRECGTYFQTTLRGRATCEECFGYKKK